MLAYDHQRVKIWTFFFGMEGIKNIILHTNLGSLIARRMVNEVICVAVFHFPKLFTATA
ncbi:hypothetical protein Hanom_Chr08g00704391 [Helianthus anomalus]